MITMLRYNFVQSLKKILRENSEPRFSFLLYKSVFLCWCFVKFKKQKDNKYKQTDLTEKLQNSNQNLRNNRPLNNPAQEPIVFIILQIFLHTESSWTGNYRDQIQLASGRMAGLP